MCCKIKSLLHGRSPKPSECYRFLCFLLVKMVFCVVNLTRICTICLIYQGVCMRRCLYLLLLVMPVMLQAQSMSIDSPSNVNRISVEVRDGIPFYSVHRFGRDVIQSSQLGFELQDGQHLRDGFHVSGVDTFTVDETWTQVWGEKSTIRNHYRELKVDLAQHAPSGREMTIIFRAYDDGVAFRYVFPEQPYLKSFNIMNELTEFKLPGNHEAWWIGAYQWNRFEYLTEHSPISAIDTVHTPLTMRTADGLHLAIHEAALVNYSTMTLERTSGTNLKANLMPWADGVLVKTSAPSVTPWRTINLSDDAGGLIESYLILNLNEPNKIEDTAWIKPSKYVGIWWEMHLDTATWGTGDRHGATNENARSYIDFAAKYGFPHVLIEGWNIGWDGNWYEEGVVFDFLKSAPGFDLHEIAKYAREKGVKIMGHHENSASVLHYESQMEASFAQYRDLGVTAVKTGYVGHGREIIWFDENGNEMREWHHGQFMVEHHQKVVEMAAKYGISLNVHEGLKDTGLRRTWPNLMTREVARGQEYNAWGAQGGNPPDHVVLVPFTRGLAGPFDYTPGVLDLLFEEYRPDNRINHTTAKELALYVVIYSPLQMAADLPENYEKHRQAFQFILDVPTDWEDTQVLNGDIGNYVTIVRKDRHTNDWYLGSISDENGRVLEVSLGFLDPGKRYMAQIYRDAVESDWLSNPYPFEYSEQLVSSSDRLTIRLAAGGGQAIRFKALD
jgi:alpha-glucosidase